MSNKVFGKSLVSFLVLILFVTWGQLWRIGALSVFGLRADTDFSGRWTGKYIQQPTSRNASEMQTFDINMELQQFLAVLSGTIKYKKDDVTITLNLLGKANKDRTITLDYQNDNKDVLQHGTIMFKLNTKATKMQGGFAGYGPSTEDMVFGNVNVTRELANS